jgi:hypothetical protein
VAFPSPRPNGLRIRALHMSILFFLVLSLHQEGAGWRAAAHTRGNEINAARRPNALLTCRLAVFWIVNQKYQSIWHRNGTTKQSARAQQTVKAYDARVAARVATQTSKLQSASRFPNLEVALTDLIEALAVFKGVLAESEGRFPPA